jgi:Zn-finger nucleic acid-binding protein
LVASHHPFCPSCGAVQGATEPALGETELACPGCSANLSVWPLDSRLIGSERYRGTDPKIHGCPTCGGAWVDRRTLTTIVHEAQAQASNLDLRAVPRKTMAMADVVVYRPCPLCDERMHRRNFGRYSGIVIDDCAGCGTYFDAGELEGVVAFVRAGGLGLTKQRYDDEALREQAHRRQMMVQTGTDRRYDDESEGWADLAVGFVRWLGRWIRRGR